MNKNKKTLEEMMAEITPVQGSTDYRGSSVQAPQGRVPIELPNKVQITTDGSFYDATRATPEVQAERAQRSAQQMPFGVESGQSFPEARRDSVEKRYGPLNDDEYADLIRINNPSMTEEQLKSVLMENAPNASMLKKMSPPDSGVDNLMLELMLQDVWR